MRVAVVIPVYKKILLNNEKISLNRCLKTLCEYDIFLFFPESLKILEYKEIIEESNINTSNVHYVSFPERYFYSLAGYNELMLSAQFYRKFEVFQYILIYQLDAYIFQDDLINWCNKGYDYIGAPWVDWFWSDHYSKVLTLPRKLLTKLGYKNYNLVGNGGFSLRKTSSFIQNLTVFKNQANAFKLNEDYFFSFFLTSYNPFFRIPKFNEALKFAFDENPQKAWILNNKELPMGCHGWPKYKSFWYSFLNS